MHLLGRIYVEEAPEYLCALASSGRVAPGMDPALLRPRRPGPPAEAEELPALLAHDRLALRLEGSIQPEARDAVARL